MIYAFLSSRSGADRNKKNGDARTQEIRKLFAKGVSKQEIAKRLCLHPTTVRKALRQK